MDKIASKLQDHYDILDFLCENYPQVLIEWKNSRGLNQSPTADADVNNPGEGDAYKE